jgi:hypothetical protein
VLEQGVIVDGLPIMIRLPSFAPWSVPVKSSLFCRPLPLAAGIIGLGFLVMPAFAQDAVDVQELQRVIEAQQRQLEAQQQQLDAQRQLLQQLQTQMESLAKVGTTTELAPAETTTVQAPVETTITEPPDETATVQAPEDTTTVQAPAENAVTSGGVERVKVTLSGMVNRMVSIVNDGRNTDAYFVDNDNAESRINLVGTVEATDDLTIGSRIELTIAPNKSGNVDQKNQDVDNIFDQRWTELSLASKRFGKLSLGKGATASFNTGATDLSGTGVIAYATISDTAGGMLFREKDGGALTDLRIGDAFNNWDGLNRRNRVRYDTPTFRGFGFATSAISDRRYDAALRWAGRGDGFQAAGAAAFADPNEDDAGFQYDGSFSILHEESGLNLTLSAGMLDRDDQNDPYNLYAKLGWQKRFFSFGTTAFAVDYTRSRNLPTDGDDGYSAGVAVVQPFDEYGTEIYGLYRLHSLDRDVEPEVEDIGVVSLGARVKF